MRVSWTRPPVASDCLPWRGGAQSPLSATWNTRFARESGQLKLLASTDVSVPPRFVAEMQSAFERGGGPLQRLSLCPRWRPSRVHVQETVPLGVCLRTLTCGKQAEQQQTRFSLDLSGHLNPPHPPPSPPPTSTPAPHLMPVCFA